MRPVTPVEQREHRVGLSMVGQGEGVAERSSEMYGSPSVDGLIGSGKKLDIIPSDIKDHCAHIMGDKLRGTRFLTIV